MAGVDIWAAHFGLTRTPFTKTIPADKLFERAAHAEAVARIHYCINEAALGVVVGDTGAGKTVAVRAAVSALDRTKFTLVYLSNPSGGCRGLFVAIATALGATPRFHKAEAINQAASLLAAEEHERHRRVVFVIDEAHLLTPEQLEEIRLLSNAELDSASPFACVLLGQPTLATRLRQGIFAALDQRISVRYHIGGMAGVNSAKNRSIGTCLVSAWVRALATCSAQAMNMSLSSSKLPIPRSSISAMNEERM